MLPEIAWQEQIKNLDIVHTDVLGIISPEAVDGHCYAIGFLDSFSRFSKVYFMKRRAEVLVKFKEFCAEVGKPGTLVSDGGGEYISKEFKRYCRNKGIRFENSAPNTPQEKGKIERIWGTSVAMARCFLDNACLDKKYWTYALNIAVYVKNMLLHSALEKTPFEMVYNEKPNSSFVKVLVVWHLCILKNHFDKKLDQTSKKGIFLGILITVNVNWLGLKTKKGELKVQKSRNERFNENEFYFKQKKTQKLVKDIDKNSNEVYFFYSTGYRSFASKKC